MTCDCNCHYGSKEKECKNCNCLEKYFLLKFTDGEEIRFTYDGNRFGLGKDKPPKYITQPQALKLVRFLMDMIA